MSEWTVSTLKEYFEGLREADQRALLAALTAVKEENLKTERAAEKRFDLLNELREGVATKDQLIAVEKLVDALKERMDKGDGQSKGSEITMGKIIAVVGISVTVLGFLMSTVVLIANGVF